MPIACFLLIGIFSFSNFGKAFADSNNGGLFYVGKNSIFKMTDGTMFHGGSAINGGTIYVGSGGTFNFEDGNILSSSATNGGGLYVASGGTAKIGHGEFNENSATNGGAIYVSPGGTLQIDFATIVNGTSTANKGMIYHDSENVFEMKGGIVENCLGGGIYMNAGTLNFSGSSAIKSCISSTFGGVYISSSATMNMSGGTIEGNSANEAGNYAGGVTNHGNFNMSDGTISENSSDGEMGYAELVSLGAGNVNISGGTIITGVGQYSTGTFLVTGGAFLGHICIENGTVNLYGGDFWGSIDAKQSINTKMGANFSCTINLYDSASITVQDYAGTTPSYTIDASSHALGTLITFVGNDTEPDLSALNISGYNSGDYVLKTQKDANGNWTVALCENSFDFPTTWKTELASTDYMSSTLSAEEATSIKFVASVPDGYTQIGTLSTGLPVYQGSSINDIAFVAKKIYAPPSSTSLFADLTKLTSIDFSNFDTSNVEYMNEMFIDCSSLTTLDLSNFDTSKVIDMSTMFYTCTGLTSLNVSNFNASNVEYMNEMFRACSSLTTLDLSNFDTTNVAGMRDMFNNCSNLTSLNLSHFDTSNVTDMSRMFIGCLNLTSLNLSSFDTTNVTDMSSMFSNCCSLASLDLSHFDTTNVTDMSSMFWNCWDLKSIDISSFNMTKVTNCDGMLDFSSTNAIEMIKTPYGNKSAIPITTGSTLYNAETGAVVSSIPANLTKSMTLVKTYSSYNFPTTWKDEIVSTSRMSAEIVLENLESIQFVQVAPTGFTRIGALSTGLPVYSDSTHTKIAFVASKINAPSSCSELFSNSFTNLKVLELDGFKTNSVTDMNGMFSGMKKLVSLDLSGFDTSNVTTMFGMFTGCSSLVSVDVSSFVTTNVNGSMGMVGMFQDCSSLKSLDLRNFDTRNVLSVNFMFSGCTAIEYLDLSSFNLYSVGYNTVNMLNFGADNHIKMLKTPYGNRNGALPISITTGSTLYDPNGNIVTGVAINSTASITLTAGSSTFVAEIEQKKAEEDIFFQDTKKENLFYIQKVEG